MKAAGTVFAAGLLSTAALLAAAAVPSVPAPLAQDRAVEEVVELRFAGGLGTTTRFHQAHTTTSRIVGITDVINGAERPMAELPPMRWEVVETLDWVDKGMLLVPPGSSHDIDPMIEREFERLTRARREHAGSSVDATLELGPLQGATVRFVETEQGWDASYAPESTDAAAPEGGDMGTDEDDQGAAAEDDVESGVDQDPAWLAGVHYRPPFAGFLPEDGTAAIGDTWEADLDAWRAVLRPTGALVYLDESGAVVDDSIDTELLSTLKGTIECTLTGVQGDTATIAVQVRVTSRKQVEGPLERDDAGIETASFQRSIRLRGAYDGTLVWDTALGRARSFDLTGKATWNIDETTLMTFENGTEWAQGKLMELSADHTLTATVD